MNTPGSDDFLDGSHKEKELRDMSHDDLVSKVKALEMELARLNESVAPFIFHGKALGAMGRDDINEVISKKDSSYLTLGAFKLLMEAVRPEDFGL